MQRPTPKYSCAVTADAPAWQGSSGGLQQDNKRMPTTPWHTSAWTESLERAVLGCYHSSEAQGHFTAPNHSFGLHPVPTLGGALGTLPFETQYGQQLALYSGSGWAGLDQQKLTQCPNVIAQQTRHDEPFLPLRRREPRQSYAGWSRTPERGLNVTGLSFGGLIASTSSGLHQAQSSNPPPHCRSGPAASFSGSLLPGTERLGIAPEQRAKVSKQPGEGRREQHHGSAIASSSALTTALPAWPNKEENSKGLRSDRKRRTYADIEAPEENKGAAAIGKMAERGQGKRVRYAPEEPEEQQQLRRSPSPCGSEQMPPVGPEAAAGLQGAHVGQQRASVREGRSQGQKRPSWRRGMPRRAASVRPAEESASMQASPQLAVSTPEPQTTADTLNGEADTGPRQHAEVPIEAPSNGRQALPWSGLHLEATAAPSDNLPVALASAGRIKSGSQGAQRDDSDSANAMSWGGVESEDADLQPGSSGSMGGAPETSEQGLDGAEPAGCISRGAGEPPAGADGTAVRQPSATSSEDIAKELRGHQGPHDGMEADARAVSSQTSGHVPPLTCILPSDGSYGALTTISPANQDTQCDQPAVSSLALAEASRRPPSDAGQCQAGALIKGGSPPGPREGTSADQINDCNGLRVQPPQTQMEESPNRVRKHKLPQMRSDGDAALFGSHTTAPGIAASEAVESDTLDSFLPAAKSQAAGVEGSASDAARYAGRDPRLVNQQGAAQEEAATVGDQETPAAAPPRSDTVPCSGWRSGPFTRWPSGPWTCLPDAQGSPDGSPIEVWRPGHAGTEGAPLESGPSQGLPTADHVGRGAGAAVNSDQGQSIAARRGKRVPGGDPFEHAPFQRFIGMIRGSSTEFEAEGRVLRLKQYIKSDAGTAMMDAVIAALSDNTRVEALYIQNFEWGMYDRQLEALTEVLKGSKIWALNVGENFNISLDAWERFTQELPHTDVSYIYVSEHHLARTDLKKRMRDAIRANRVRLPKRDAEVIVRIGNMWWNPKLPDKAKRHARPGSAPAGPGKAGTAKAAQCKAQAIDAAGPTAVQDDSGTPSRSPRVPRRSTASKPQARPAVGRLSKGSSTRTPHTAPAALRTQPAFARPSRLSGSNSMHRPKPTTPAESKANASTQVGSSGPQAVPRGRMLSQKHVQRSLRHKGSAASHNKKPISLPALSVRRLTTRQKALLASRDPAPASAAAAQAGRRRAAMRAADELPERPAKRQKPSEVLQQQPGNEAQRPRRERRRPLRIAECEWSADDVEPAQHGQRRASSKHSRAQRLLRRRSAGDVGTTLAMRRPVSPASTNRQSRMGSALRPLRASSRLNCTETLGAPNGPPAAVAEAAMKGGASGARVAQPEQGRAGTGTKRKAAAAADRPSGGSSGPQRASRQQANPLGVAPAASGVSSLAGMAKRQTTESNRKRGPAIAEEHIRPPALANSPKPATRLRTRQGPQEGALPIASAIAAPARMAPGGGQLIGKSRAGRTRAAHAAAGLSERQPGGAPAKDVGVPSVSRPGDQVPSSAALPESKQPSKPARRGSRALEASISKAQQWLERYDTAEEAARAHGGKARRIHGDAAVANLDQPEPADDPASYASAGGSITAAGLDGQHEPRDLHAATAGSPLPSAAAYAEPPAQRILTAGREAGGMEIDAQAGAEHSIVHGGAGSGLKGTHAAKPLRPVVAKTANCPSSKGHQRAAPAADVPAGEEAPALSQEFSVAVEMAQKEQAAAGDRDVLPLLLHTDLSCVPAAIQVAQEAAPASGSKGLPDGAKGCGGATTMPTDVRTESGAYASCPGVRAALPRTPGGGHQEPGGQLTKEVGEASTMEADEAGGIVHAEGRGDMVDRQADGATNAQEGAFMQMSKDKAHNIGVEMTHGAHMEMNPGSAVEHEPITLLNVLD